MQGSSRFSIDSETIAEVLFLLVIIWIIAGPLSGLVLGTQNLLSSVFTRSALQVESTKQLATKLLQSSSRIRTLERQLADAQIENSRLKQQSTDTEQLRALLELKQKMERETIGADIITRDPDNWFDQVTIDKGTHNNVELGSAVITNKGIVGQVVKVSNDASVVRLLSNPDQKLGVQIKPAGIPGVLSGRGKNAAVIDFVPVGAAVDIGNKVISLGNGAIFPTNHPVGTIIAVKRDTNGTTLSIEVALSESLYDLNEVLVVPPLH